MIFALGTYFNDYHRYVIHDYYGCCYKYSPVLDLGLVRHEFNALGNPFRDSSFPFLMRQPYERIKEWAQFCFGTLPDKVIPEVVKLRSDVPWWDPLP